MPDPRTIAFYDSAADRYDNLTKKGGVDDWLRAFIDLMPPGGAVLDLGCGPARASAHMRDAGLRPDPVDASGGMIELANQAHDIGARLLTFDDIDMVAAYDGVWANFSLLHAARADLPRIFAAIAAALRPAGVFHIGMKIGSGEARDHIDRLYTDVEIAELQEMLETAGFAVIASDQGREVGCAGTNDPFVVMRARKNG